MRPVRDDVTFLPALAATFMLVFARIGTMVMLLPGLGEIERTGRGCASPSRGAAAVLLPLHQRRLPDRPATFGPVVAMLGQELFIGAMLGLPPG